MKKIITILMMSLLMMGMADGQTPVLYGMTKNGGFNSYGNIFSINGDGTDFQSRYSCTINSGGYIPSGKLIFASDSKIYGVTQGGGSHNSGDIFTFNPLNNSYTELFSFNNTNGAAPNGLIQASNGKFYGLTQGGGDVTNFAYGNGVIFCFDPSTNIFTDLYHFHQLDGIRPYGNLMQATDGKLYGLTTCGGSDPVFYNGNSNPAGSGTMFCFDIINNTFTKLVDFIWTNGNDPECSLMQASNGLIYGRTNYGGLSGSFGVIFSYDIISNNFTVLRNQICAEGGTGEGFIEGTNHLLYSMRGGGEGLHLGYIYSYEPSNNVYTVLYSMDSLNGIQPAFMNIIQAIDGNFYGTTWEGGLYGKGVIFQFNPITAIYTKLHDFNGIDGDWATVGLLEVPNSLTTGINPIPNKETITIYPNPASTTLTIHSQLPILNSQLIITDVLGNEVYHQAINNSTQLTINISQWSGGVYFYEIRSGLQIPTSVRGKFVKE